MRCGHTNHAQVAPRTLTALPRVEDLPKAADGGFTETCARAQASVIVQRAQQGAEQLVSAVSDAPKGAAAEELPTAEPDAPAEKDEGPSRPARTA